MCRLRLQIIAFVASWCLWATVALTVYRPADFILGNGDSLSHLGHVILFLKHGLSVYRTPSNAICPERNNRAEKSYAAAHGFPDNDVCDTSGAPLGRVFYVNWQDFPQPYPPGSLLYAAPEAWMFAYNGSSFRAISVVTRFKYLCGAHILIWLLYRTFFRTSGTEPKSHYWLKAGLFVLLYFEVLKWSMSGFYDAIAIAAVVLGVQYISRKRGLDALLALSVGIFLHYRALWFAPLFAIALYHSWNGRSASDRHIGKILKLVLAVALIGVSAYLFVLLYPSLRNFPQNNPIYYRKLAIRDQSTWDFGVPLVFILGYLASTRRWPLMLTVIWQCFMLVMTPQTWLWHSLFLIPILVMAQLTGGTGALLALSGLYWLEAQTVFRTSILPGPLMAALLSR